jgi:HSP20 family protein
MTYPFHAFEAMQERLNRLLGDAFTGYRGRTPLWHPDIDVEERADGLYIEVRLPGVAPDEVAIDVTGRELTIRAVHGDQPATDSTADRAETAPRSAMARRYADFSYRLTLPADVDVDAVEATMDHGLLTVRLPRTTAARSRHVEIGRRREAIEGETAS